MYWKIPPMTYQVTIIGGGVVGSYLAFKLSEEGIDNCLIDKRAEFGKKSCSGVVSERIRGFSGFEKFIENELNQLQVKFPDSSLELNTDTLVLNRNKLDPFLIDKASSAGTDIIKGTKATKMSSKGGIEVETDSKSVNSKILIDCSGTNSFLERNKGFKNEKEVYASALTRIEDESISNRSKIFLDKRYSSSFFAWIIPRREKTEYGVITKKNALNSLNKFLNDLEVEKNEVITNPIQIPKNTSSLDTVWDNSIAVGESACQVKPLSGGGIIYGLISADIAKEAVLKSLEEEKFNKNFLKREYQDKWKEEIAESIELQLEFKEALYSNLENMKFPEMSLSVDYDFLG